MKRNTIALQIKPGKNEEFYKDREQLKDDLRLRLNFRGVNNFSAWSVENLIFVYYETNGGATTEDEERAFVKDFLEYMSQYCQCLANPFEMPMRLMYEDIGIIREDKTKIRHRVFVTKLKPGYDEEYKRRHDELIASRNGKLTEGPESNFTIWNTGDYIFGYCELDPSMEREQTEAERQATVAWETRGLEIMDWITDDVDWLTGQKHCKIELVFQQEAKESAM